MSKTVNVAHLAKLTNLTVSDDEVKKFENQFAATLQTIKLLEELDTSKVNATPQVTGLTNVYRQDEIDESRMFSQEDALKNANKSHNGYFVVGRLIE